MKYEFVPNEMIYVKHFLIKLVEKIALLFKRLNLRWRKKIQNMQSTSEF
jgi:hypothetical protein